MVHPFNQFHHIPSARSSSLCPSYWVNSVIYLLSTLTQEADSGRRKKHADGFQFKFITAIRSAPFHDIIISSS